MTLDEYQKKALSTVKDEGNEFLHRVLGLAGESGEVIERTKKLIRDHNGDISMLDKGDFIKEVGDVLWYVATLSDFLGYSLEEVAQINVDKLADRKKRRKLRGSGDNR